MVEFRKAENSICPICELEMGFIYINSKDKGCKNGCFKTHTQTLLSRQAFLYAVTVGFGKDQCWIDSNRFDLVQEKIEYWKENYRYIAEILEGRR